MTRRYQAIFAFLLALGMLSGCGSGSGGDAGSTVSQSKPLSKQEYLNKGNVICHEKKKERIRAVKKADKSEVTDAIIKRSVPLYREMVTELKALGPPEKASGEVAKMIASMEKAVEDFEKSVAKQNISIAGPAIEAANEAVRAVGLRECKF